MYLIEMLSKELLCQHIATKAPRRNPGRITRARSRNRMRSSGITKHVLTCKTKAHIQIHISHGAGSLTHQNYKYEILLTSTYSRFT